MARSSRSFTTSAPASNLRPPAWPLIRRAGSLEQAAAGTTARAWHMSWRREEETGSSLPYTTSWAACLARALRRKPSARRRRFTAQPVAGCKHWAGHAQRDAIFRLQNAHALGAPHPDAIGGQQLFVLVELRQERVAELQAILLEAIVGLVDAAADAKRVRGEPRAAVFLENLQDLFAIAESVEQRRQRRRSTRRRREPPLSTTAPSAA